MSCQHNKWHQNIQKQQILPWRYVQTSCPEMKFINYIMFWSGVVVAAAAGYTLSVQRSGSSNSWMWGGNGRSKWLKIGITNKPVECPFQIAQGVLKSFRPVFLFVEALCDWIAFHFVILDPVKVKQVRLKRHPYIKQKTNLLLLTLTCKEAWNIFQMVCCFLYPWSLQIRQTLLDMSRTMSLPYHIEYSKTNSLDQTYEHAL